MRFCVYFIFFKALLCSLFAQENFLRDSLIHGLRYAKNDTVKARFHRELCVFYTKCFPDSAIYHGKAGVGLAKKASNTKLATQIYNDLAGVYYRLGEYKKAVLMARECIKIFKNVNDYNGLAGTYGNIALVFGHTGDYDSSLVYYKNALQIVSKGKDKAKLCTILSGISSVYREKGEYHDAMKFLIAALKISETSSLQKAHAQYCLELSYLYRNQNDTATAMMYLSRAEQIYKTTNDLSGMAKLYSHLGSHYSKFNPVLAEKYYLLANDYFEKVAEPRRQAANYNGLGILYTELGNYEKGMMFYEKALEINRKLGEKYQEAGNLINIGILYTYSKKYDAAKKFLEEGIILSKELGGKMWLKNAYNALADNYELQSKSKPSMEGWREAFYAYKTYIRYNDSIVGEQSLKNMNELKEKYESEKKDLELLKQKSILRDEEEKQRKRTAERNFLLAGVLLLFVLVFIVFRSYRLKQKANEQITQQKEVIEEKNKEITDSILYAQRIQRSLLATEKYIEKELKRLKSC
jgi:tetratricopeptide (TPR) repeat protein